MAVTTLCSIIKYDFKEWHSLSRDEKSDIIAQDMNNGFVQILKIPAPDQPGKFSLNFAYKKESLGLSHRKPFIALEDKLEADVKKEIEQIFAEGAMLLLKDANLQNAEEATTIMNSYNFLIHKKLD